MRFNSLKTADALTSRAEAVTSMVLTSSEMEWPFVTIPHFEIRGERARQETRSEVYGFSPFVELDDQTAWESYSIEHQYWVLSGRGIDVDDPASAEVLPTTPIIPTKISYENQTSGKLLPYPDDTNAWPADLKVSSPAFCINWQLSPVPALTYTLNLNLRSSTPDFETLVQVLLDSKANVLSDFVQFKDWFETILPPDEHQVQHEDMVGTNEGKYIQADERPHSILMTPVFRGFPQEVTDPAQTRTFHLRQSAATTNATQKSKDAGDVVGLLWAVIPWDWQLSDLLPDTTKPVFVVLDNSCGQQYTYEVTGRHAILLGEGDLHDPQFDNQLVTTNFVNQPIVRAETTSSSTGNNVNNDTSSTTTTTTTAMLNNYEYVLCEYVIQIYPTAEMRGAYDTGRPETFALVMAAIFLVVATVFLIFVRYVQQRQDMVMATAMRTSAIVSSLFPANVRERIMKDAEEQGRLDIGSKKGGGMFGRKMGSTDGQGNRPDAKLEDFVGGLAAGGAIGGGNASGVGILGEGGHDAFKSKPIADLFPDATVLFADLVGFTAWYVLCYYFMVFYVGWTWVVVVLSHTQRYAFPPFLWTLQE